MTKKSKKKQIDIDDFHQGQRIAAKRRRLTTSILVLFLLILVLLIGGFFFLQSLNGIGKFKDLEITAIGEEDVSEGSTNGLFLPDITSSLNINISQAETKYQKNFILTSTNQIATSSNQENPAQQKVKLATFVPRASGIANNIKLSLYLNSQDIVVSAEFEAPPDIYGAMNSETFKDLLTQDNINRIIKSVGVIAKDFIFAVPPESQYVKYVNPKAKKKKIAKEEFSCSGEVSTIGKVTWGVYFNFDYTQRNATNGRAPINKLIRVSIS